MGTFVNSVATSPASGTAVTATLPTFANGDVVLIQVSGKYNAASTRGATPAGWTLVRAGSGGVVTTGNDAGDSFQWVYAKLMIGGEANPAFAATLGDSINAIAASYRPAAGKQWLDAGNWANIPFAFGDDTTIATPLTSGAVTFSTQPVATIGDVVCCFGAIPTDLGTANSLPVVTFAAGIGAGTVTARVYTENAQGADTAAMHWDHVGFTGTSTSTVTMSITTGATNNYGPVLGLWLREVATVPERLRVPGNAGSPRGNAVQRASRW